MNQTQEHIHVNAYGEFDQGCICHGGDFFTVKLNGETWSEIDPVVQWDGWGCVSCNRVFNDDGVVIARPESIEWLDA